MNKMTRFHTPLHFRKQYLLFFLISLCFPISLMAQSYTYSSESFEENVWANAPGSTNSIASSTGTWTVAKSNVQTNIVTAQDGSFSLFFANKNNALISPRLDNGAGVISYYAMKTGSRTINVDISLDGTNWTTVETYTATSSWVKRTVSVNNADVRFVRFWSNSNGGLYVDQVLITTAGAPGVDVTTSAASTITQTSAVVGGHVVSTGEATIISCGVCYNDTGYPEITSNKVETSPTTGDFTVSLSGLEMGKTYYAKAYAITDKGTSFGLVTSFTTRQPDATLAYWTQTFENTSEFPSSQPTSPLSIDVAGQGTWIYYNAYKSTNASYITDGSACDLRMLKNGSYVITPVLEDGITTLSFSEGRGDRDLTVYTSTNGGSSWSVLQTITSVRGEAIVLTVNNLAINRIKIANESGSDADVDNISVTVFPNGTVPSVTTSAATAIGKNTATLGGEVTNSGSKTTVERGICWSTTTTPIIADNKVPNGESTGAFSVSLSGLPAGTTIRARAYATSRAGTGYGEEVLFSTLPPTLPVVTTKTATNVKGEIATVGGIVTDDGGASVLVEGICWNATGTPTVSDNKTTDSTGVAGFEHLLTSLVPNTSYFYRAYATTLAGTGYGEEKSFTTGSINLPVVTTAAMSAVYSYKAIGGGAVTNDGGALTERGVCWNNSGNPTIADSKTMAGTGAGDFTCTLTGLTENMRYYARAYATNTLGTVYGEQVVFETPLSEKLSKPIGYGEGTTGGGTPTAENTVVVKSAAELVAALNGDKSVIIVSGTISTQRISVVLKNKTLLGLPGARLVNLDQTATGSGILHLNEGSKNVIIQNIIFLGPGAYDTDGWDLLTNKGCNKLWVDHCEFQDGVDDCFDNTNLSDSITVSWCKFSYLKPVKAGGSGGSDDHRFANLIGGSDSDKPVDGHYSITWQNCWWAEGCVARMVRGRNTEIHILNCYWNSQVTSGAIGLTAGSNGSTCYVEGGVFACTGKVSDISTGNISINFVDCKNGGVNIGTVSAPTYEYTTLTADEVVSAVTSSDCGAGASLVVTESGEVYSGCPATPILSVTSNNVQEVFSGNPITPIVFTWGGTATGVSVANLPSGLTSMIDSMAQTLTITGIPSASGTFTVTTIGGTGLPITKQVTIGLSSTPPPTLTVVGTIDQTVSLGSSISVIVFTWGGGATDVTVLGLPSGIAATKDASAKTLTLSGVPASLSTYTVTTVGGTGDAVSLSGTLKVMMGTGSYKIAYVTNPASSTYMNDTKILASLKADPNFVVTEVNAGVSGNNYSEYDLVVFSEVAASDDPGVAELKGISKPFLMMKVHSYKTTTGCWSWTSSATAYGQNDTQLNLSVLDKTHPMFKDVTWINGNEVQVLTSVGSLKGLTYMDPSAFKSVSGGTIQKLASVKDASSQVSVFQIPAGTTVAGTLIPKPFIQIGINSNSYANVTADGVSMVKNTCFYLLGVFTGKSDVTLPLSKVRVYPTRTHDAITIESSAEVRSVQVVSLMGKVVASLAPHANETECHLSQLPKGLFTIVIKTSEGVTIRKIIKE